MSNNPRVGNTTVEWQCSTVNTDLGGIRSQKGVGNIVLQFKGLTFGIGAVECFEDRAETMECLVVPSFTVGIELCCVLCSDANGIVYIGSITDACGVVTESDTVVDFLIIGQFWRDTNDTIVVDIISSGGGIKNYTISKNC